MNDRCRKAREVWESCRSQKSAWSSTRLTTLGEIVNAYRKNKRGRLRAEIDYYSCLTLKQAVARAARAERPDGKRHGHQTRIRRRTLQQVALVLGDASLRSYRNFDDL